MTLNLKDIDKLHLALRDVELEMILDDSNLFEQVKDWPLPNIKKQNEQWKLGIANTFFDEFEKTFTELCPKLPKQ